MAGNYKSLYKSTAKVLKIYQNQIVPELKKKIRELEEEKGPQARCENCCLRPKTPGGYAAKYCCHPIENGSYCSFGVRKENVGG